jgi:hypothetical protein
MNRRVRWSRRISPSIRVWCLLGTTLSQVSVWTRNAFGDYRTSVVYLEIGSQEFSAAVIGAMMLTMLAKVDKRLENFMLRWDDIDTPILR